MQLLNEIWSIFQWPETTHTNTFTIVDTCTFPHNVIPAISVFFYNFLPLSDTHTVTHTHIRSGTRTQTALPELSGLIPLLLMCVCQ